MKSEDVVDPVTYGFVFFLKKLIFPLVVGLFIKDPLFVENNFILEHHMSEINYFSYLNTQMKANKNLHFSCFQLYFVILAYQKTTLQERKKKKKKIHEI